MADGTGVSRRQFLGRAGSAAWMAGFVAMGRDPVLAQELTRIRRLAGSAADEESSWSALRSEFVLEAGLTYLNNGTTGVMPRVVLEAETRYQTMLAANPKIRHTFEYEDVPRRVRQQAAEWIGATLDETALTHNTTEGLNIVAQGLPLESGDHVVITDQEHPGHLEPWRLRAKRDGITVTQAKIPIPLPSEAAFVDAIRAAMTPRTRVVAFPHIPTTVGMIAPAREVCALARERGAWSLVDGAHAAGQMRFSVKEIGCDFYATSPHKWLHAPLGNGIFYARKELHDVLWPLTGAAGWDRFSDARKYSAFGNRSWATAMALGDALDFAAAIGIDRIEARLRSLTARMHRDLAAIPGIESMSPQDPRFSCGMSAYRVSKHKPSDLVNTLRTAHQIVVAEKVEGFRVDIGYFILPEQISRTLEVVEQLMRRDRLTA